MPNSMQTSTSDNLQSETDARDNLALARAKRFILSEDRNFVEVVEGTLCIASTLTDRPRPN